MQIDTYELVNSRPTVNQESTEMLIECWLSIDQDVDQVSIEMSIFSVV